MNLNVHRYASIYILLLCDIVPKSFSLCVCFVCASAFRWYKKEDKNVAQILISCIHSHKHTQRTIKHRRKCPARRYPKHLPHSRFSHGYINLYGGSLEFVRTKQAQTTTVDGGARRQTDYCWNTTNEIPSAYDMHMKRDATNLKVNYIRDREVTKWRN